MEALEALSIAAGIVQLLGAGDKLCGLAQYFGEGDPPFTSLQYTELCNLVESLPELADAIKRVTTSIGSYETGLGDDAVCACPIHQTSLTV